MSDKSPTPDLLPRFQKGSRLDKCGEHSHQNFEGIVKGARDAKRAPAGPAHDMDKATKRLHTDAQASLGAGGGRLNDAVKIASHCGVAPKADFGFLRKG